MKEKENKMTEGKIYRLEYASRMGRFHYANVTFARYMGNDNFVDENNEPKQVVDWMINDNTKEVDSFGQWERNFVRQDW